MQICPDHWGKLKELLAARGLDKFIAASGEEVAKSLESEMTKGLSKETFDPLMYAHNRILTECMNRRGSGGVIELMQRDGCPICYCRDNCGCPRPDCRENYEKYPEFAADEALGVAKHLGLIAEG